MKVNEFISTLRNKFRCDDDALILQWLELGANLAEAGESEIETDLDDIARALYYVKNNFNETTLQKTLTYPTLADEVISCAVLFHTDRPIEVVDEYAKNGIIECGYLPDTYDERGSLSIVYCAGSDDSVFICHDITLDELQDMAEQAMHQARENGSTVKKEFENIGRTDHRIRGYGQNLIGTFMMNIYNLDEKCSAFGYRVTCLPTLGIVTADKHPALIDAEREAEENKSMENMYEEPYEDEAQSFSMEM